MPCVLSSLLAATHTFVVTHASPHKAPHHRCLPSNTREKIDIHPASHIARAMSHRQRVLALYHRILLTGARWSGPADERKYIIEEAQRLFRKNKNIEDPEAIERKLFEAEVRPACGTLAPRTYASWHRDGSRTRIHVLAYAGAIGARRPLPQPVSPPLPRATEYLWPRGVGGPHSAQRVSGLVVRRVIALQRDRV